jgi:hypothetical protein
MAIKLVEKRYDHPRVLPLPTPREDDDETSGNCSAPTNALQDDAPGPVETLIEAERPALTETQIRTALSAITNQRHREAVILRYLQDWPIKDKDPNKQTLCKHFVSVPRNTLLHSSVCQYAHI